MLTRDCAIQPDITSLPPKVDSEEIYDIEITEIADESVVFKTDLHSKGKYWEHRKMERKCFFSGVTDLHVGQKFKIKIMVAGNSVILSLIQHHPDIENAIIAHA